MLPATIETTASTASTGIHPAAKECQAALPCIGPNPSTMILASTKKLATFDPDAMKQAMGAGAPS